MGGVDPRDGQPDDAGFSQEEKAQKCIRGDGWPLVDLAAQKLNGLGPLPHLGEFWWNVCVCYLLYLDLSLHRSLKPGGILEDARI